MHLEATYENPGSKSVLQYSIPNIIGNNVCIQFWYHMYSSTPNTMGSLNVKSEVAFSIFPITIANINGNQGNTWKHFQFKTQITNSRRPVNVRENCLFFMI